VGGDSPYVIVLTPPDSLPPGLALSEYGVLSGTPTAAGSFDFTVQATDANLDVVSKAYTLDVAGVVIPQYVLVVEKFGSGTGNVAGSGIDCGTTCNTLLDEGTEATLIATPAGDSLFTGWGGDCAGTGSCITTVNAHTGVSATFVLATQQYTLTVTHVGSGTVKSSPKGINCGKQCSHAYTLGDTVTLTAKPKSKHLFLGWSGACSGTDLTCTVPISGSEIVNAEFN
jgi:hypothetical protein